MAHGTRISCAISMRTTGARYAITPAGSSRWNRANLARAVGLCLAAYAERPRKTRWLRGRRVAAIIAGRPSPRLLSPRCIGTITRVAIQVCTGGYCSADTKRIIELGSGWGTNLFYLWLGGMSRSASMWRWNTLRQGAM